MLTKCPKVTKRWVSLILSGRDGSEVLDVPG